MHRAHPQLRRVARVRQAGDAREGRHGARAARRASGDPACEGGGQRLPALGAVGDDAGPLRRLVRQDGTRDLSRGAHAARQGAHEVGSTRQQARRKGAVQEARAGGAGEREEDCREEEAGPGALGRRARQRARGAEEHEERRGQGARDPRGHQTVPTPSRPPWLLCGARPPVCEPRLHRPAREFEEQAALRVVGRPKGLGAPAARPNRLVLLLAESVSQGLLPTLVLPVHHHVLRMHRPEAAEALQVRAQAVHAHEGRAEAARRRDQEVGGARHRVCGAAQQTAVDDPEDPAPVDGLQARPTLERRPRQEGPRRDVRESAGSRRQAVCQGRGPVGERQRSRADDAADPPRVSARDRLQPPQAGQVAHRRLLH
mmetsp:Transcript_28233/g.70075  ORF Transcript_28233/g.70075 Transcript_28233/m.70075 type:complete len:372 (-) Transcript_28233:65-1180(-)